MLAEFQGDFADLADSDSCATIREWRPASSEHLDHLARELASLTHDERAKVLARAARLDESRTPHTFVAPKLTGGAHWIGGDLSREHLYGDDGR